MNKHLTERDLAIGIGKTLRPERNNLQMNTLSNSRLLSVVNLVVVVVLVTNALKGN
jgi:hypothetical protein